MLVYHLAPLQLLLLSSSQSITIRPSSQASGTFQSSPVDPTHSNDPRPLDPKPDETLGVLLADPPSRQNGPEPSTNEDGRNSEQSGNKQPAIGQGPSDLAPDPKYGSDPAADTGTDNPGDRDSLAANNEGVGAQPADPLQTPAAGPTPTINYAGSTIEPDSSSR